MENQSWFASVEAGAVLVTVNQRLAREYMRRYSDLKLQAGESVWPTPRILPWRAWLANQLEQLSVAGVTQRVLMPAVVQQQVWRECVEEDKPTHKLLDEHGAARQAKDAWLIAHAWDCMTNPSDSGLPADQAAFVRWSRAYQKRCDIMQCVDEATLPDFLCTLIEKDPTSIELPSQVLMAGFIDEAPQQSKWKKTLEAQGCKVSYVHPSTDSKATAVAYIDDEAELLGVAQALRSTIEQNPKQRLGVVIPNLHQRRAACMRLFDQHFFPGQSPLQIEALGRPYDISLGTPIDEQPVVKAALLILQLKLGVLRESSIAEFVLSPYAGSASQESRDRQKLDRDLRQKRIEQVSLAGLIKHTQKSSAKLREALVAVSKIDTSQSLGCAEWSSVFGQVLESAGWPGKGIDSAEYQAVQSWKRCLDDLQLLDNDKTISANKAMQLLRELLRDRLFQLETPAKPIQIMGRLESHGIEFDKLWVCGMDATQWPAPSTPTPFLSIVKQKEMGVPQADASTRLALAEKEVDLWLKSAPEVLLSYCSTRDGAELIPAAVFAERKITMVDAQVVAKLPAEVVRETTTLESVVDTHGLELEEGTAVRGGARLLENQSDCPFRAFALHRLNIRPLEEAGLGLDARQQGTVLHLALELFWTEVKTSQALLAMDEEQLYKAIDVAANKALDDVELGKTLRALELRQLHRVLADWLALEKTRPVAFEAIEFETKRTIERSGIEINLMVDRIDRLEGGEKLVLDYKTGISSKTKDWEEERIKSPQLPLYSLTDDEIQGVTFAQVAKHKVKFLGLGADRYVPRMAKSEDWEATVDDWRNRIDAIALEVKQGVATVTPAKYACDYCDVLPLCRFNKQAADNAETEDDTTGGQY